MTEYSDFAERLELFFGQASDAVCRVYARYAGAAIDSDLQLSGSLTGPNCLYAETLPATFSFVASGPGKSLLAEALVPEPCFWTPEMPHLYRAQIQLRRGEQILARLQRPYGMRRLGAAGGKLIYDGKRWVPRAVFADALPSFELAQWHAADTAMVVRNPTNTLCDESSRVGVLLLAMLEANEAHEIDRLRMWPAVGMAVLPTHATIDPKAGRNMLLAQRVAAAEPLAPAPWAEVVVCEGLPKELARCSLPVLAMRTSKAPPTSVDHGRAACDHLQRDLASARNTTAHDFAGYIV